MLLNLDLANTVILHDSNLEFLDGKPIKTDIKEEFLNNIRTQFTDRPPVWAVVSTTIVGIVLITLGGRSLATYIIPGLYQAIITSNFADVFWGVIAIGILGLYIYMGIIFLWIVQKISVIYLPNAEHRLFSRLMKSRRFAYGRVTHQQEHPDGCLIQYRYERFGKNKMERKYMTQSTKSVRGGDQILVMYGDLVEVVL
jgi:hypothetical protein